MKIKHISMLAALPIIAAAVVFAVVARPAGEKLLRENAAALAQDDPAVGWINNGDAPYCYTNYQCAVPRLCRYRYLRGVAVPVYQRPAIGV